MAKVLLPKNSSRNGDVITIGLCINLGFQRQEAFSDPNGTSWRSIASSVEAGDKGAGASEAPGQTKEEFSANDTSRPKVFKTGPQYG